MIYNNTLIKEINERLAERRKIAEAKAQKYTDVLNADKDYSEAFNKYNSARFDFSKAKYTGNKDAEEKASAEIGKAAEDMSRISKKLGITADMLQPDYTCKQCNDTGFLKNGKRCSCFKKLAIEITLDELGIDEKNLPDFSSSKDVTQNKLDKFYPKFIAYCDHFSEKSKNVVVSGSVGTGKSHLVGCIANELKNKGFNVIFLSACELNTIFLKYHTAPVSDRAFYISLLTGCDLLVIDDLGSEPIYKNVTDEYILMILSERLSNGMPYIVTTNLTQTQLLERYGDRIVSRLNDKHSGVRIEINGEDLRRKK